MLCFQYKCQYKQTQLITSAFQNKFRVNTCYYLLSSMCYCPSRQSGDETSFSLNLFLIFHLFFKLTSVVFFCRSRTIIAPQSALNSFNLTQTHNTQHEYQNKKKKRLQIEKGKIQLSLGTTLDTPFFSNIKEINHMHLFFERVIQYTAISSWYHWTG